MQKLTAPGPRPNGSAHPTPAEPPASGPPSLPPEPAVRSWTQLAKWGGSSIQAILDLVQPRRGTTRVVFYSIGDSPEGGLYYEAHPIEQMSNHLSMLAYDMKGPSLSFGHSAPLRRSGRSRPMANPDAPRDEVRTASMTGTRS